MKALLGFRFLFARHLPIFGLALCLSLVTLAAGIGLLAVAGWFLSAAFLTSAAAAFNLFGPSSAVRGLSLLRIGSRYGEKLVGHDATLRSLTDIRSWLFVRLVPQAGVFGSGLRHGDLVSRLTADVDALDVVFLLAIGPMLTSLVTGAVLGTVLFLFVPQAGLAFVILFLMAALGVPCALILATRHIGSDIVTASAALRIEALDGLEGRDEIIAFGAQGRVAARFDDAARRLARARAALGVRGALAGAAVQMLTGAALLALLWQGVGQVAAGALSGPVLAGLALAVIGSFEATAMVTRSVARLGAAARAAERLGALTEDDGSSARPGSGIDGSAAVTDATLCLRDVTVAHGNRPVACHLSLSVPAGSHVAIKGPSGSGKSTLLMGILCLADRPAGEILLGGVDVAAMPKAALYTRIALLEQSAPVFMGTIRDNLLLADPAASDAMIWQALSRARLEGVVRRLGNGLDSAVGEAGHTLSAGEARRLCLARVLLSPADILLLDEPTSGLDRDNEERFLRDLASACIGRTVIVATHADLPDGAVDTVWTLSDGALLPQTGQ